MLCCYINKSWKSTKQIFALLEQEWLAQGMGLKSGLVRLEIGKEYEGIRFVLDKTYGAKKTKLYAFYID